jgi:hypothetical protein
MRRTEHLFQETPVVPAPALAGPRLPCSAAPRSRGSVLVIVMVTLIFATLALIAFLEKAANDLLVDQREVRKDRLRTEAYSALEVTLAVLEQFREAGQGLRSPAEGWSDPLEFAGYTPSEGRTVNVTFEDESGKLSLPRASGTVLANLFKQWQVQQRDAEELADALMGWMRRGHVYSTAVMPDYEHQPIPFEPPGRSLRSYSELATIERVREVFYDEDGRRNEYWTRFVESVSLFDFQRPNINAARPDTLAALGEFDPTQQQTLTDYLTGAGPYASQGPGFFRSPGDAQAIAGPAGNAGAFASTISALRINVTVIDGRTEFRISAVIAPPGGASAVDTNASAQRMQASAASAQTSAQRQAQPSATQAQASRPPTAAQDQGTRDIRYPFTLLEIRENS